MKRMLINATQQEELRVALVDGQQLYDLDIETLHSSQKKSNIYKGKITRIEPSLEAVFVDYGSARHGFLPFKEIAKEYLVGSTYTGDGQPSFKDMIRVGQDVLVQIDKEERGNKGAALTTYISLAGRFLVLMPNNPRAGGVSRRIQGDDRRELRDTLDSLDAPDNMGVIVRTAGVGRAQEELQWDLDFLLQLWDAISEEYHRAPPQRLIYQESNIIVRALRDYLRPDIGQILIDDERVFQQATDFMKLVMPNNIGKLKLYNDNIPLFTRYQIEGQIETAYQRNVQLPSGGELVIDYTEALVSIDINSSRATKGGDIEETAYQTNLEAADEIARQLRLRDLGGLIVIDFIDMGVSRNRKDVEQRLMDATNIDRARIQIGRISRFGLLEMSRQRLRPSLDEASHQVCPRCKGQGSIRGIQSMALSLLRLIEEEAMKERTVRITGELPVSIATFLLNEKRHAIRQIELRNSVEVILVPNPNLHTPDYHIERLRDDEVSEEMARVPSYRVPVRRESEEDATQKAAVRALPEQAAVKGVVPQSPVPQAKGLGAFFSKVVALFKEDRNAGKPGQKSKADGNDRNENRDSSERSRRNGREQESQRNARRNNGERRRRYERDEEDLRDNAASDEIDNIRQELPAVAERAPEKEKSVQREERGERQERSRRDRGAAIKDEVNPSIEALTNPPEEINGREVRKGRPRDVNAVRGQGKAEETRLHAVAADKASTHELEDDQYAEAEQIETAEEAVVMTDLQDGAQDFVPTAAELQGSAPGMVAMLREDMTVETESVEEGNDMKNEENMAKTEAQAEETVVADAQVTEEEVAAKEEKAGKALEKGGKPRRERKEKAAKASSNPLRLLPEFYGQSIWYDNIHRGMLEAGELTRMIAEDDLRGVTSNPAIFQKAFAGSDAYDAGLRAWLAANPEGNVRDAFFALAIEDIQAACDQMMPVFEKTGGTDGMVSLEVSPDIAHDAEKTVAEALDLHRRVARENVMIKVPATQAGVQAIARLIAEGIHVNVTLLFSVERYAAVLEAYMDGLKQRVEKGQSIDFIRSVASFFVSRVDSKIDDLLGEDQAELRGRAAIANAQLAYAYYLERISHDDWVALAQKGAAVQRLLWASTGTKNPAYSDVRYVDQLIGVDTVNTVPPATYDAFRDHGQPAATLLRNIDQAPALIREIEDAGIDLAGITDTLEQEGVAQFEGAFADLLNALEAKMNAIRAEIQESEKAPPAAEAAEDGAPEAESPAADAPVEDDDLAEEDDDNRGNH